MDESQRDLTNTPSNAQPSDGPGISMRLRALGRIFSFAAAPLIVLGGLLSGEQTPFLHPLTRLGFFSLFLAACVLLLRVLLLWLRPGWVRHYAAQLAKQAAHLDWVAFAMLWYGVILGGFALLVALAPTWVFRGSPAAIGTYFSVIAIAVIVVLVAAGPLLALRRFDRPA
jgi:hypothetical protein